MKFFDDTVAAFKDVAHHGYYVCNNKNYLYRYNALVEATRSKQAIDWNFNNEVYNTVDWRKPLNRPLSELYRERAQQLRDKYKYLILAYSGGSDSDNILRAFVDNNIHLDEVWVDWPHGLIDKVGFTYSSSVAYENLPSEWVYTIGPKLEQLAIQNPDIKIHISDAASSGVIEDYDDTSVLVGFRTSYQNIRRQRYISNYQQQLYDKGIDVALVTGTDKPALAIRGTNLVAIFHDLPTVFKNDLTATRHTVLEYFYWTPDMPYIVVNQIHELINYFMNNVAEFRKYEHYMRTNENAIDRTKSLNNVINQTCYPTWDNSFQTNKFKYTFENNQFNNLSLIHI